MARAPLRTITIREDGSIGTREASALLGVTEQSLRDWIARGCPSIPGTTGRGRGLSVHLPAVIAWRIADQTPDIPAGEDGTTYNLDLAKAVDMHYRAISRQAAARKELGQLVSVDLVADAVEEDYQRVRSRLNSVPGRVSVQAAAESDASIVRTMIARAIHDALENLSAADEIVERAGGNPSASVFDQLDLDGTIEPDEDEDGDGDDA
ncbi:hypothetical protein RSWS8N_08545 [Cereibacter sphaeroides WS8N]|uniref:hypothetical protein n=1 Tax=Cereibacter sphaeroides TaxID=1063 RepID=UPI00020DFA52|nr:hypothetical protein [Cereibacter sphaeroides]EGJ22117.1 hypothetical protein RSWS8N_08545 [Cereibacter sphaeroides WS8N]